MHQGPRPFILIIPKGLRFDSFHGIKPATRAGAVRSAMRGIGQAPQRSRWPVSCHRRPGAFGRMRRCAWLEVGRRRRQSRLACGQNHPGEMGQTSGPLVLSARVGVGNYKAQAPQADSESMIRPYLPKVHCVLAHTRGFVGRLSGGFLGRLICDPLARGRFVPWEQR